MEAALPRPQLLIEEARERQRRRHVQLALVMIVALAVAGVAAHGTIPWLAGRHPAVTPAATVLPSPCALLTNADVAHAFGAKVAYRTRQPQYANCSWSGWPFAHQYGQQRVTIDVAAVTRAEFERAFSTFITVGPEPGTRRIAHAQRIDGVGDAAFAQSFAGTSLFVWHNGVMFSIETTFIGPQLAAEKRLAAAAIARLDYADAQAKAT